MYCFRQENSIFHLQSCVFEVQLIFLEFTESGCRNLSQSRYRGRVISIDNYLASKLKSSAGMSLVQDP